QLQRAGATVVIVQFGQLGSLRGEVELPRFVAAYERLLDQFAAQTRRIVILSPTPFEKGPGTSPDLSARNGQLGAYVEATRALAARRGHSFVDLFRPLKNDAHNRSLTRDGLHLNTPGHWEAA